jgi:hypothetical protein
MEIQAIPKIVKVGDNRAQAEYAQQMYSGLMTIPTYVKVKKLIESMPEDGPIPRELKDIFFKCAFNADTDGSLIVQCSGTGMRNVIFTNLSYGVQIDNIIIIRLSGEWSIYKAEPYIIINKEHWQRNTDRITVRWSTFYNPDYFNCDIPGKYYVNDKVFNIQNSDDLVYKDQFLIRGNLPFIADFGGNSPFIADFGGNLPFIADFGESYTIVQPEQAAEFAERRHFICELPGYSLNETLTLISLHNYYYIAKCVNLGENNVFKVYAEQPENYVQYDLVIGDFLSETEIYINDVEASAIEPDENNTLDIGPGKVFNYNGHTFKNHYPHAIERSSVFIYDDVPYILTEFGLIYEISKDSGNCTKPAESA